MAQRRKLPPIHPGELLRDELTEIGVSLNKLARALRVPMNGISAIVSGKSAYRVENYYLACGVALLVILLLRNLVQSRVGRGLLAIHDGEKAANAMGINTASHKLRVFLFSAVLAAVAGAFFTHYAGGIGPSESGALKSVRYVALAAAGGMSNLWGVAIVSIALNYASLRGWFGTYDNAVFGLILIAIVSLAPDGPLKPAGAWLRKKWGKDKAGMEVERGAP